MLRALLLVSALLAGLALTACDAVIPPTIGSSGQAPPSSDAMEQAFGPVERKAAAGPGWVVLSSAGNGTRQVAYLLPHDGGWRIAGRPLRLSEQDVAGVSTRGDLVVLEARKEDAPQFTAYRYGTGGLEPVDYYAAVAPEPAVSQGHFLLVNKHLNVLWHYRDGQLVKAYRVATGRQTGPPAPSWEDYRTNFFTPEGEFTIINFVMNPPYNPLKTGDEPYEGGAPGNPLGTRWMGFSVLPNDNAWIWGIHGTSQPELIGTWASDGCIRMNTQEAEALFEQLQGQNPRLQIVPQ